MSARIGDDFDIGLLNTEIEKRQDWDVSDLNTWNLRTEGQSTIKVFDKLYKAMESKITLEVMKRRMRMERGKSKKKSLVELKHDRLEAKV
jgi:hypothetical protein